MLKKICIMALCGAISCSLAVPAFAASTRKEYRAESASVKQEINTVTDEIRELRAQNKEISNQLKTIRAEKKETGTLSVDSDTWSDVKEIRKEIKDLASTKNSEIKALRQKAREQVSAGNYDEAISLLNEVLELKKVQLKNLQAKNELWTKIGELLANSGKSLEEVVTEDGSIDLEAIGLSTGDIADALNTEGENAADVAQELTESAVIDESGNLNPELFEEEAESLDDMQYVSDID